MQKYCQTLGAQNPVLGSKLKQVIDKWEKLWENSKLYVDRLQSCKGIIHCTTEAGRIVDKCERVLISQDNMASDADSLKHSQAELQELEYKLQQNQAIIEDLNKHTVSVTQLVAQSRPGVQSHPDLEKLQKDVNDITSRSQSIESAQDLLLTYQSCVNKEQKWVEQTEVKVTTQPPLADDAATLRRQIEPVKKLYQSLESKKYDIEAVNKHGANYIRES
ncbi:unnamed protein product [Owenia fusiformis]|uniref:Uncharacterized protein n=1 Tax=Owenia fusiformis TaxID=6347 RepID=A0A8S4QAT7_OWEFU|nr:unnamed protein product [Owenia fusiformis]